jgi:putative hemolysin
MLDTELARTVADSAPRRGTARERGRPVFDDGLEVVVASGRDELIAAQKLRFKVFAEELGARLDGPIPGVDVDVFDAYCDHLIARHRATREIVGTYRLLRPEAVLALGCSYADSEFDLSALAPLRGQMVEMGRSCVAPEYRSGATIQLLWAGIARFMSASGYRYLTGCASIPAGDGGHGAASLYAALAPRHPPPAGLIARPRQRLPLERLRQDLPVGTPPLIKGYLRCGGKILGEPAWDRKFGTADILMILDLSTMSPRYARHFFGDGGP